MPVWEQIIIALVGAAVLYFFWPGAKRMLEESRRVEEKDWQGALLPIGVVVLFVITLVAITKS